MDELMKFLIFLVIILTCNISLADSISYEVFDYRGNVVAGNSGKDLQFSDFREQTLKEKGIDVSDVKYKITVRNYTEERRQALKKNNDIEQAKERLKKINPDTITDSVVKDLVISLQ
jgi:hypothetical protein